MYVHIHLCNGASFVAVKNKARYLVLFPLSHSDCATHSWTSGRCPMLGHLDGENINGDPASRELNRALLETENTPSCSTFIYPGLSEVEMKEQSTS